MHKYLKYRDRTLALALILLILLGLYAIFSNSSFVQAVPLPNSSNDLVSFSGGSESENSAITVIVMFYDLDDSGGQYKSLTEHSFVAGTGATLGFNPPEKTGYVWKKEYSKLPKTLPKGTSKVYLVLIPEDSGDEVPNPEYGVITDSDLMPEQPIEESSSENTSTAGSEESSVTTEATESTTTVETTKPTESTKQTEATESTKSTDPTESTKSTDPTESAKPTEEEEPTESTKPEDKPDEEEPKPGEVEDNVLIEQKPGGAEFTTPDDFDEEEAKEGSIKLEIYYIDKEGELQIFSLDYQLAEGLAGQSYKLILPEFKGYSLFDEPLSTLLEGELKAGTKKIKLAYVSEESDLTDAEIRETISDLLNEDGQYLSTEEESDDEKESEEKESEEKESEEKESEESTKETSKKTEKETEEETIEETNKAEKPDKPDETKENRPRPSWRPNPPYRPPTSDWRPSFPVYTRPNRPNQNNTWQPRPIVINPPSYLNDDVYQLKPDIVLPKIEKASEAVTEEIAGNVQFETYLQTTTKEQKVMVVDENKADSLSNKGLKIIIGLAIVLGASGIAIAVNQLKKLEEE